MEIVRKRSRFIDGARSVLGTVVLGLFAVGFAGCSDDDDDGIDPPVGYDAEPILRQAAHGVIFATYEDLRFAAADLNGAIAVLRVGPSETTLAAARSAWRAARVPWEQSEGFLFGPVSDEGLDPAIDSWPVNETDLNAVLASGEELDQELIDGLGDELKGFHTLEYLLFGLDSQKPISAFTAREFEYLGACAADLSNKTERLAESWDPKGENFGRFLIAPGDDNPRYASQASAMQELLEGMVTIADEVANGKIDGPLSEQDVTLEESRFSRNSIADFQDNIRSIQNLFLGRYDGNDGPGFDEFVRANDPGLEARVKTEIQAAIDAIGAIPAPFTTAIFEAPQAVAAAQIAVRTLQDTIDRDVRPVLADLSR